jgi:NitT/TauT family transport system substrate-binding protein
VAVIILALTIIGSQDSVNEGKVRVAFFPNIGHAVPIIGTETEIFANGLGNNTIIEKKIFDSGPQVIESLFANSVDIAYVGPGPAVNGFIKSESHSVIILAGAASGGASFVVHPNSKINSVEDFGGKRIAAPQIANTQDVSLRHYLSEHGYHTAEKGGSVFVLNVPNPEIYTLFTKGDIDAAWVPEPWATIFVEELDGKRLFFEEELWPENKFASVLLVARSDYVENNPEIINKWLESHEQAVAWINSNPDDTEKIFNDFMNKEFGKSFPKEIIKEALSNLEVTSDPIRSSIHDFAERADSLGYLGRHGYSLDGIFYDEPNLNSLLQERYTTHD